MKGYFRLGVFNEARIKRESAKKERNEILSLVRDAILAADSEIHSAVARAILLRIEARA